jgi:hypothetical protein
MKLCNLCAINQGLKKGSAKDGDKCEKCGRELPPNKRVGCTHKIKLYSMKHSAFVTINQYPDGRPCEVFVSYGREGSHIGDLISTMGMMVSLALQHGANLSAIINMLEPYANNTTPYAICEALKREYIEGYWKEPKRRKK